MPLAFLSGSMVGIFQTGYLSSPSPPPTLPRFSLFFSSTAQPSRVHEDVPWFVTLRVTNKNYFCRLFAQRFAKRHLATDFINFFFCIFNMYRAIFKVKPIRSRINKCSFTTVFNERVRGHNVYSSWFSYSQCYVKKWRVSFIGDIHSCLYISSSLRCPTSPSSDKNCIDPRLVLQHSSILEIEY